MTIVRTDTTRSCIFSFPYSMFELYSDLLVSFLVWLQKSFVLLRLNFQHFFLLLLFASTLTQRCPFKASAIVIWRLFTMFIDCGLYSFGILVQKAFRFQLIRVPNSIIVFHRLFLAWRSGLSVWCRSERSLKFSTNKNKQGNKYLWVEKSSYLITPACCFV